MESTNEASGFIFSSLKYFRGYRLSTKIFYSNFFYNKINSNENFPDYSMYVCMYVCMYICICRYVLYMCVCTYVCMHNVLQ